MFGGRLVRWSVDAPVNLAVFRVAVGVALLALPDLHRAASWADLPESSRIAPVGLEWALSVVPVTPDLVRWAYRVMVVTIITGTLGVYCRASWTLVTLLGVYVLGVPQLAGSVFHYHHLLWFSALLATSPSADALSVDAWLEGRNVLPVGAERSLAYGLPLRAAWLLIGCIFFFPGLHKLLTSGLAWAFSDNLQNHMYAKWVQFPGFEPLFRVDRFPALLRAGALGVIVFELGFVAAVLFRRARPWAALVALVFHQATAAFMALRFSALYLTYVCFFDWDALFLRWRRGAIAPAPSDPGRPRAWFAVAVVGGLLLLGNVVMGVAGESDGWPFACYPKFDRMAGPTLPELTVELGRQDGSALVLPPEALHPHGGSQRYWALSWSLIGAHDSATASPARFDDFWAMASSRPKVKRALEGARVVRFYRTIRRTAPEARGGPPESRTLLYARPVVEP